MTRALQILLCVAFALRSSAVTYGPSLYAPPGAFPTSLYQSYYNNPTATSAQPQPVISDPVLVRIYPSFCEAINSLMYIYSTKYIRPGSPTRTTYPRYVITGLASSTSFSSSWCRLIRGIPTPSHLVSPTKRFWKTLKIKSNGCLLPPPSRAAVARCVLLPFRSPSSSRSLRLSKPHSSSSSYVSSSSSPAVATAHSVLRRSGLCLRRWWLMRTFRGMMVRCVQRFWDH